MNETMEVEGLIPKGMKDESLGDVIPFWTDDNFHDVDLVCNDGVVVGANRSILALRSEKFRKILFGTTKTETVDIPYNSQAVNTMLEFIHMGSANLLDPQDDDDDKSMTFEAITRVRTLVALTGTALAFCLPGLCQKAYFAVDRSLRANPAMALAVLAQFDDGVDEVPKRLLDRALATIQSSDLGLDSLKDKVAGCLLGDLSSYVMEEVFKDEAAGQPKDQQQLFQLVNMWYEHSDTDQVSARQLVLDHFCLERMDPVFLSSSLVMTSDLVDQDMLLEAFRSQAVAAQKQYGMIPPVARLAFWKRSLSTFTQAKEGHCMDVLEYPADKLQTSMKLRWTIQVLDDGANSICVGVAF